MRKLYFGGTIITMDQQLYQPALLTENERILAVGELAKLRSLSSGAESIDLEGRALLPGFIDSHSHFSQVAAATFQVRLDDEATLAEIREHIQAFLWERKLPEGSWIIARDYDHNRLPGSRHLTLAELDSLAPGYPLLLQHQSGHMGLFNTQALNLLNVTAEAPLIEGGTIGMTDGNPNGYMEENAFYFYLQQVPSSNAKDMVDAYKRAQQEYASHGITTVQDGMFVEQMIPLYQMLLSKKLLKLDLAAYPDPSCLPKTRSLFSDHWGGYHRHLRFGGLKLFLDGSPQGRTAWMRTPYLGEPENDYGYGVLSDEQVMEGLQAAAQNRCQVLAHCNGDAAAAQYLRCMRIAQEKWPVLRELRPVLIHGQLLGLDQLKEVARLAIIVSFFVAHTYHWGDAHIRHFGLERASQISPAKSALNEGVLFTFHQDAPVIQPDMIETLWCAVNRQTRSGVTLGEEQCVSTLEALRAVTVNAAYQYGEESDKGTLTAGKRADFVILNHNPLDTPPQELRSLRVLETIKNGETVYCQ
ncbi:MAG: amidohydrolase [Eubacteriales bacterium]|nr:amidohydrolase [Eubacteriales bacterium]